MEIAVFPLVPPVILGGDEDPPLCPPVQVGSVSVQYLFT